MSARILSSESGIVIVLINGKLTHPEFLAVQQSLRPILARRENTRILVLAEGFEGLQLPPDSEETSFRIESEMYIDKVAIIGNRQSKDLADLFTTRKSPRFSVECFQPAELRQ